MEAVEGEKELPQAFLLLLALPPGSEPRLFLPLPSQAALQQQAHMHICSSLSNLTATGMCSTTSKAPMTINQHRIPAACGTPQRRASACCCSAISTVNWASHSWQPQCPEHSCESKHARLQRAKLPLPPPKKKKNPLTASHLNLSISQAARQRAKLHNKKKITRDF